MWKQLILLLLWLASSAWATTYYVHPDGTCSDDNAGTSSSSPWCTPPGTRNEGNTGFLSGGSWGSINGTTKIACGDTILLYPGDTHDNGDGDNDDAGAWCISATSGGGDCNGTTRYYTSDCAISSTPITIRIATSADWSGAPDSGNFTLSGTGITGTQTGAYDVDALLAIGAIDGLKLKGISDSRRIIVYSPGNNLAGSSHHLPIMIAGDSDEDDNDGMVLEYVTSQDSRDVGISVHAVDNYRFSYIKVENADSHCVYLGTWTNRASGVGVWEHLTLTDCGAGGVPFSSDAIYVHNTQRAWFTNATIHDVSTNCTSGGHSGDGDQSRTYRGIWRDLVTYKCGAYASSNVQAGFAWDGDGDIEPNHSYTFVQGFISYGQQGPSIWTPHSAGRGAYWHVTAYLAPINYTSHPAMVWIDLSSDAASFWNSIYVPVAALQPSGYETVFDQRSGSAIRPDVKPYLSHLLIPYPSSSSDTLVAGDWASAWPTASGAANTGTSRTFANVSSWNALANKASSKIGNYAHGIADLANGNCDSTGTPTYGDCDFRLCTASGVPDASCTGASPAIDAGTYFLRTDGAEASGADTITVQPSDADSVLCRYNSALSEGTCGTVGNTDTDLDTEYGDPRNFFIEPATCPDCAGDVIQIKGGVCTGGAAAYGSAERAKIVSMTATTITLDRNCTWPDDAGVHRKWYGAAPDMGALESGGDCHGGR